MTDPWRRETGLTPERRLDVLNLLNRTDTLLGREAIDETRRRIVVHGWRAEHWLQYRDAELAQYAMVNGADRAMVEMCGGGVDEELLAHLLAAHDTLDWWTRGPQEKSRTPCEVVRTLQLMQVTLPIDVVDVPLGAALRNFEPGLDERIREPWFDPSGFLLLEIDGRLAASCWTKVHELHPDRFGEIYIISVHPEFQGRSLGRVMLTQGLEVLRRKGVSRAMLFVDQSNASAVALYESLGFTVERDDRLVRFAR